MAIVPPCCEEKKRWLLPPCQIHSLLYGFGMKIGFDVLSQVLNGLGILHILEVSLTVDVDHPS